MEKNSLSGSGESSRNKILVVCLVVMYGSYLLDDGETHSIVGWKVKTDLLL
jgi:hypothetical protein